LWYSQTALFDLIVIDLEKAHTDEVARRPLTLPDNSVNQ